MNEMTSLERLVEVITRPKVYIQTHNYPDQDALASAYGLQELLRYKGIESVVYSYHAGGLKLSVRSELPSVDAGKIVKQALSGYPGGGGGHAGMAGGFVANLSETQAGEAEYVIKERIIELVAECMKSK